MSVSYNTHCTTSTKDLSAYTRLYKVELIVGPLDWLSKNEQYYITIVENIYKVAENLEELEQEAELKACTIRKAYSNVAEYVAKSFVR